MLSACNRRDQEKNEEALDVLLPAQRRFVKQAGSYAERAVSSDKHSRLESPVTPSSPDVSIHLTATGAIT